MKCVYFLTVSQSGHGSIIKVFERTLCPGRFLSMSKQLGIYQAPEFSDRSESVAVNCEWKKEGKEKGVMKNNGEHTDHPSND